MNNNVSVIILCGGKGERLRPLTESIPKPLVEINGRPILEYLIDYLRSFGVNDIFITSGYKAEKIFEYFENKHKDLNIQIVDSGESDIIDRIKSCAKYIHNDFILLYGDTLANVNFEELQRFHKGHDKQSTITLYQLRSQFGIAELDENDTITRFVEKPILDKWINIGNFYFDKDIFEKMKEFNRFQDFLEHMGNNKEIKGYKHTGIHITVNTFNELEEAKENIHKFK